MENDKGILAKVRKCFENLGRSFSAMEDRVGKLEEKLQKDNPEQKSSVKTALQVLKSGQAESHSHEPQRTPPKKPAGKKNGGTDMKLVPSSRRQVQPTPPATRPQEPSQEVTANEPL